MNRVDKWQRAPLPVARIILLHVFYWGIYMWVLPRILIFVQREMNLPIQSIVINTEWLNYLISASIGVVLFWPLLKEERHIDISKMAYTLILCISCMFIFNIGFGLLMNIFNGPSSSINQSGLNTIMNFNKSKFIMMVVIFAPLLEELVFRGGIFRIIRSKKGFWFAAIVSSLMFGFMHIFSSLLMGELTDLIYLVLYGGLGMMLAYAYEYNRSICSCIILHMVYNFIASATIIFS